MNCIKLLDYRKRWKELEQSRNPFSIIVRTHLKGLETRRSPVKRLQWKIRLYKALHESHYSRKDILGLFHFIDWVLALPNELEQRFQEIATKYEEKKKVPYITSVERMGIEKGIEKGIKKGEANMLLRLLETKFGPLEAEVSTQICSMDSEEALLACSQRIFTACSVQEALGKMN